MAYSLVEFGTFVTTLNQACHIADTTPVDVLNQALGLNLTQGEVNAKLWSYVEERQKKRRKGKSTVVKGELPDNDDWGLDDGDNEG